MQKYTQIAWIIVALLLPLQLQAANAVAPESQPGSTAGVVAEAAAPAQTAEPADNYLSINKVWIFMTLLTAIPFFNILRRTGLHPALSALLFVPALGFVIVMAILAFARWPNLDEDEFGEPS